MAPEKLYRNTLIKLQNIDRDNAFSPQYSWREEVGGGGGGRGSLPRRRFQGSSYFFPPHNKIRARLKTPAWEASGGGGGGLIIRRINIFCFQTEYSCTIHGNAYRKLLTSRLKLKREVSQMEKKVQDCDHVFCSSTMILRRKEWICESRCHQISVRLHVILWDFLALKPFRD